MRRVTIAVAVLGAASACAQLPGPSFKDCPECPEMVVVPAGDFLMGSPSGERFRNPAEGPQHRATILRPFAIGRFEVTFDEWDACVSGGGCNGIWPSDEGWGRGNRPVINVSWDDAKGYVHWLLWKTGKQYRLLSESEWEYVARAGTTTRFWWGDDVTVGVYANCNGCGLVRNAKTTMSVGRFKYNPFGLFDTVGNVWEWVDDCWHDAYDGAPEDGSAWTADADCELRVIRGGGWYSFQVGARSAVRAKYSVQKRDYDVGFRVARDLD